MQTVAVGTAGRILMLAFDTNIKDKVRDLKPSLSQNIGIH